MAEEISSSESSSIDVSGRQTPTGVKLHFGGLEIEIYPSGHSRLVCLLPSVDSVNDVRPNFLPDGGGIEEPERTDGEIPWPGAETFHGTDGLDRCVQSILAQYLSQIVVNWADDDWERIFENLDVENALRNTPSYSDQLRQITNNLRSDFLQLLQETSSNLSSEDLRQDLRVFCVPLCWSSKKRVDFWSSFSNMLKAMGPNPPDEWKDFISELESQGPLLFDGKWIDRIVWEWIDTIDPKYRPHESNYKSVRGLIRFVRNRWHHLDGFQETRGLRSAESFCNYLDELFPSLLRVLYGVVRRFCSREPWFRQFSSVEVKPLQEYFGSDAL